MVMGRPAALSPAHSAPCALRRITSPAKQAQPIPSDARRLAEPLAAEAHTENEPELYRNGELVIVIDCSDLARSARFWSGVLDSRQAASRAGRTGAWYRKGPRPRRWCMRMPPRDRSLFKHQ